MTGELLLAFSAGAVSFFAPCVVPLLPAYVSYLGGAALPDIQRDPAAFQARMVRGGLLFVAGFGLVFVALGVGAGVVGGAFVSGQRIWVQRVGGVVVILMGLALLGALPTSIAERSFRFGRGSAGSSAGAASPAPAGAGRLAPLILGLVFGTAWTPCVGPVLASILAVAASRGQALAGGLLLTSYTLGLGLPFIVCSVGVASFPAVVRPLARFSRVVSVGAGVVMIGLGVLLVLGLYQSISGYLAQPFAVHA